MGGGGHELVTIHGVYHLTTPVAIIMNIKMPTNSLLLSHFLKTTTPVLRGTGLLLLLSLLGTMLDFVKAAGRAAH